MEDAISERTKRVSRTLAVISVAWGLTTTIKHFWQNILPFFLTSYWMEGLIGIGASLVWISIYIWLAVLLWMYDESKFIRRWALLLPVMLFKPMVRIYAFALQNLLAGFLSKIDAGRISYICVFFLVLLSCGIIYWGLKRFLFYGLNRKEIVDSVTFARNRKIYFGFLSVTFWLMLGGSYFSILTTRISDPKDPCWPLISIIGIIVPAGIAVCFYLICIRVFVTKPLRTLESKPAGLEQW